MEEIKHFHEYGKSLEPLKAKLKKKSKGYNWEQRHKQGTRGYPEIIRSINIGCSDCKYLCPNSPEWIDEFTPGLAYFIRMRNERHSEYSKCYLEPKKSTDAEFKEEIKRELKPEDLEFFHKFRETIPALALNFRLDPDAPANWKPDDLRWEDKRFNKFKTWRLPPKLPIGLTGMTYTTM